MKKNKDIDWNDFSPGLYLSHNYKTILAPDKEILKKLVKNYEKNGPFGSMLEIGAGPNLYPILAALPFIKELNIIEYSLPNINYLKRQLESLDPIWDKWISLLKEIDPIVYDIDFAYQFRTKTILKKGNIFSLKKEQYDLVSMHFVVESISSELSEFFKALKSFIESLKIDGFFVTSFMEGSSGYDSPGSEFPAVPIGEDEVKKILTNFSEDFLIQKIESNKGVVREGHIGMLFAFGHRAR